MAWSKTVGTYPATLQEVWLRLMETGQESTHTFSSRREATAFLKRLMGLRYAHMHTKDGAYRDTAPRFTAELQPDGLTVRLCSVDDTAMAKLGAIALQQRREQDDERGIGQGMDKIAGDLTDKLGDKNAL